MTFWNLTYVAYSFKHQELKLEKKDEILQCHRKAIDLHERIRAKQDELAKCEEAHKAKLEEKQMIS